MLIPLSDICNNKMSQYSRADAQWEKFIHEHRSTLMDAAVEVTLKLRDRYNYRYRPNELLQLLHVPPEINWIVLWLNDLAGAVDLLNVNTLYVLTDTDAIVELYNSYASWQSNMLAADLELSGAPS